MSKIILVLHFPRRQNPGRATEKNCTARWLSRTETARRRTGRNEKPNRKPTEPTDSEKNQKMYNIFISHNRDLYRTRIISAIGKLLFTTLRPLFKRVTQFDVKENRTNPEISLFLRHDNNTSCVLLRGYVYF